MSKMVDKSYGKVKEVGYGDFSFTSKYRQLEIYLKWYDGYDNEELNILFMSKAEAERVIKLMQKAIADMDEHEAKMKKIISETNFSNLYNEFERKYNKYPVQMACYEAFGYALNDGLIDKDTYDAAEIYYGNLWNYVGD